jgi:hypothetical protein
MDLLNVLSLAADKSVQYTDFGTKRTILHRIERAADHMERCIPAALPSGDTQTDAWISRQAREMACSLRKLKREVFTTDATVYGHFIWQLRVTIILAATGQWNRLPRDTSTGPKRQRIRDGLISAGATISRAVLPLAILWLVQRFIEIPESTLKTLLVGGLIWACLTVIAAFDPLFGEKISALKDVGDLISSARGNKQKK